MTEDHNPIEEALKKKPVYRKERRSWGLRIAELTIWAGVAIATALIMIAMSESLLPENF